MDASDFTPITETSVNGGLLASLGLTTGLGSVLVSSCCVVPITLGSLGAGAGLSTMLAALAPYRWPLIVISGLVMTGAWFAYLKRRKPACASGADCTSNRSRGVGVLLTAATIQLLIATLWTSIEPALVRILPWA